MSRSNPFVFAIAMLIFVALFGGASLMQGGLYIDTHEGDTYHLMDILFRMELGQKSSTKKHLMVRYKSS